MARGVTLHVRSCLSGSHRMGLFMHSRVLKNKLPNKREYTSARIDGEGRCFYRQRLVTLNRLFPRVWIKILKELVVKRK